jgi:hypothetical protein
MSLGSESYAGKLTSEEEKHIQTLTRPEDIAKYIHSLEVEAGLRVRDEYNDSVLHEVPRRTEPQPNQASLTVDGKTFTGTDAELNEQLRAYFQSQQQQPTTAQPARGTDGRFVAAADQGKKDEEAALAAARKAELDLAFKRGSLSTSEYLEQSGAFAEALEKTLGAPIEEIAESFQSRRSQKYVESWETATAQFFQTEIGRYWPGGEANKKILGELIEKGSLPDGTPFVDAEDKVAVLTACFNHMKENDLIKESPEATRLWNDGVNKAQTREELDEFLGKAARERQRIEQGRK